MTGELRGVQFIYTRYNSSLVYEYSNTSQQFQILRKGTHTTFRPTTENTKPLNNAADPALTPHQPDAGTNFPREGLR